MRDIILTQKAERDSLLEANYVERDGLADILRALSNNLIKVIIGPRRAGKSVFAIQALRGTDFAYLNFDDERLVQITDYEEIIKGLKQIYGDTKNLLFDEIQNLPNWQLFIERLRRRKFSIVATGSNSKLLSGELASRLTGRYAPFQLLPFSFREFLRAKKAALSERSETKEKQGELLRYLGEYLQKGGYPEVVVNEIEHRGYLKTLFDGVLLKDIVIRHNIRHVQGLKDLGFYLLTNHSTCTSFNELKKNLGFKSVSTVEKYASYLNEAFMLFTINRFSYKAQEQTKSPKKVYAFDAGMIDAVKFKFMDNMGSLVENAVAIELLRRGKEFYYYRSPDNKEVDFVIKEGIDVAQLIQVCYDISAPKTEKREVSALIKAASEFKCDLLSIITWDDERTIMKDGFNIHLVPLHKWLLE